MFTLYANGAILTMDPARPRAGSLLAFADRVVALFDEPSPDLTLPGGLRRVDLRGRCLLPAFTDSHIHLLNWGLSLDELDLSRARSLDDLLALVATAHAALPEGRAIRGAGWSADDWPGGPPASPRREFERVAPGRAVSLGSRCHHVAWASGRALELAGLLDPNAPPVEGGEVVRDARGEPTGVLKENALWRLYAALPEPTEEENERALDLALSRVHRCGVAAIHSVETLAAYELYQRRAREGRLPLRVLFYLPGAEMDRALALKIGEGERGAAPLGRLKIGGAKFFSDGALGGRTAWMSAPYMGEPTNFGIATMTRDEANDIVARATEAGLGLAIHAIGDAAISMLLDAFELGRALEAKRSRHRPPTTYRVEHLQTIAPEDIARCARLGVWGMMQPVHLLGDWKLAERNLGPERAGRAHVLRSLLDGGVRLAFGSDAPIEVPDVPLSLHAAVNRRDLDEKPAGGWRPEQRIRVEEALRAHTLAGAEVAGDAARRGWLGPGVAADFAILDRDPTAIPSDELRHLNVEGTTLDGEFVFASEALADELPDWPAPTPRS